MNFFEKELRMLFEDGRTIPDPIFAGRACLGTLGEGLQVRAEFVTTGHADYYEALRLTILNNTTGVVDKLTLRLGEVMGLKKVPSRYLYANGLNPYIWSYEGKLEWYAYQPTEADRDLLRKAAKDYLSVFPQKTQERQTDSPKLVYICAPLRGDVEKNIAFATEKAKEVFEAGDIPICPHLMFPPFASPEDPVQDERAREMGLKLVESCQQLNVYGKTRSAGMWEEIHHASELGIPVVTDQPERSKAPARRKTSQKSRQER